jgi:hypothetical protein
MTRRRPAALFTRPATALGLAAILVLGATLVVAPVTVLAATTRNVPEAYPTIQAAIDAAVDGDTVSVAAGTYAERIDFLHKSITVQSRAGRATTIVDGGDLGVVVKMATDAGDTPILRGFTIRNGGDSGSDSGAIDVSGGPALIEDNLVSGNTFCDAGAIHALFSAATIRGNVISNNHQHGCSGGIGGGGMSISGAGTVHVVGNTFEGNSDDYGAAMSLFASGAAVIDRNVFRANTGGAGGAISIINDSPALIQNNLFAGNVAGHGGAIWMLVPSGSTGPDISANTFVDNQGSDGSAIYADGHAGSTAIYQNIVVGAGGAGALITCSGTYDPNPPQISYNDVVASSGARFGGTCAGLASNIDVAPTFVNAATGDYHLASGSAGIDATNAVSPSIDFDGDVRPQDGDGDGIAKLDMGFDEVRGSIAVTIDILPGTTPNLVKLTGKGLTTAVGLLSSPGFDARQAVTSSLCFGDAEAPAQRDCTLAKPLVVKDLDHDGDLDLSLVFDNPQSGIDSGDTTACLNGRLPSGLLFTGCDAIVTR